MEGVGRRPNLPKLALTGLIPSLLLTTQDKSFELLNRSSDYIFPALTSPVSAGNLSVEVEIGRRSAGDKSSSTTKGHILNCPLHEDDDAALELNYVHEMDKRPDKPSR